MLMPDVNVLVYAHRSDSTDDHEAYAAWLTDRATGREPFALSSLALVGVVRIVTNPRVFHRPSTLEEVFAFIGELVARPNARVVHPGPHHLAIFEELCRSAGAVAKLAADAHHAAVAVEHGCTLVTTDADFDRLWNGVLTRTLETFTDHYSPSVQNTLYRMGRAVLEEFPEVERIWYSFPNVHHIPYDLARFGIDNESEVFHATRDPYGQIEGWVERRP